MSLYKAQLPQEGNSMKRFTSFIITLILVFCISADILTPDRITVWDPGVPGGITVPSENIVNVIDFGADFSGKADCKDAITQAIEALPLGGGVVYFPAGSYYFCGTITIGKDNVVIRGDGYDETKLLHDNAGLCFDVIPYKRGQWQNLLDGYTKGSKTVTVEDGSKFTVGVFAEIQQANDSALMYTDPNWIQSWAENAVGQLFEVVGVEGNSVTFRTPLHFDVRSDLNPQIRPQGFVRGVGFENFYIERLQGGNSTFQFKNAAYCWVRNIESYYMQKSHITNNTTIRAEHGEKVKGEFVWDDGIADRVIPVSYYLHKKSAFYGSLQCPSTESDIENCKNPAQLRWESGNLVTGVGKRSQGRPVTVSRKREDLPKIFDLKGRLIGFPEASSLSNSKVSSGIYLLENGKRGIMRLQLR